MGKLVSSKLKSKLPAGKYSDGDGLYLQVSENGKRKWIYRYQLNGRRRDMTLGSYDVIGLAEARDKHAAARKLVLAGTDPLEARYQEAIATTAIPTFDEAAALYIAAHRASWRNAKHGQQWENTLKTYASPVFGNKTVDSISTSDVLAVLTPIWHSKTETANRVRNRIELVIDFSKARGWASDNNPARLKGHIDQLLPKISRIKKVVSHPAMPYKELGAYYATLNKKDSVGAIALQLLILTATRTSEVTGACWDEIDLAAGIWNIPGERMKAGKPHRVPLSRQVIELLNKIPRISKFVFPGIKGADTVSNMILAMQMRRDGVGQFTPHGMRSAFRDWSAEETTYPNEVAEMALAHTIKNAAEAAYRRGDLLEKRRDLMQDWADFITGNGVEVTMAEKLRATLSVEELEKLVKHLSKNN